MLISTWISPKTNKGQASSIVGKGFFALEPIKKDEVVAIKAGHVMTSDELKPYEAYAKGSALKLAENIYCSNYR